MFAPILYAASLCTTNCGKKNYLVQEVENTRNSVLELSKASLQLEADINALQDAYAMLGNESRGAQLIKPMIDEEVKILSRRKQYVDYHLESAQSTMDALSKIVNVEEKQDSTPKPFEVEID